MSVLEEDKPLYDADGKLTHWYIKCSTCETVTSAYSTKCENDNCNVVFKFLPTGYVQGAENEGFNNDQFEDALSDDENITDEDEYVECSKCGVSTRLDAGKCKKCKTEFKISSSGYCMGDNFICDTISDEDTDNDDDDIEMEYEESDTDIDSDSDSDDECHDDEVEYVPKKTSDIITGVRRTTRSMKT